MPRHEVTLPNIVSVRFTDAEFNRLVHLARTNRRTVSQTVRRIVAQSRHQLRLDSASLIDNSPTIERLTTHTKQST